VSFHAFLNTRSKSERMACLASVAQINIYVRDFDMYWLPV
jgi:hypothetical protein